MSKITVTVYDPAMCCSSGVCGPDVDQTLLEFDAQLKSLSSEQYTVERFNLGQQPQAFAENTTVTKMLQDGGVEILPLIFVNGSLRSQGGYPSKEQFNQIVTVINLGGSVAAASQPCCDPKSGCC